MNTSRIEALRKAWGVTPRYTGRLLDLRKQHITAFADVYARAAVEDPYALGYVRPQTPRPGKRA